MRVNNGFNGEFCLGQWDSQDYQDVSGNAIHFALGYG